MLLKMQSIWQDWQDLFTIRAVKRGRFHTAEMARELAIWYGNEYVRLSNPLTFDNSALTVPVRLIPEELELFNWIKSYCIERGSSV